jgi:hypothetical protein
MTAYHRGAGKRLPEKSAKIREKEAAFPIFAYFRTLLGQNSLVRASLVHDFLSACTAVAVSGLTVIGSEGRFVVFDYVQNKSNIGVLHIRIAAVG